MAIKLLPQILWLASCNILYALLGSYPITAQIVPDTTLPVNSQVTQQENTYLIEGGSRAGTNLFHSFQEFSVPSGDVAFFNNAADIQNILTRVTGGSISNIDGVLRANNTANLFLMNPNGIIFGSNARLDIGGSFIASTARSLKFADGFEFSSTNLQTSPLLTISVPTGLQYGTNPRKIQVQGNGQGRRTTTQLIDTTNALRVQPNQTLALVGGDLNLEGATLKTAGGRIELGSVAGEGFVNLSSRNRGFALTYGEVQSFSNIQLSQQATVDASGTGGGEIAVQGKRVTLTNGSHIEASTLGSEPGQDLVVNATESLEVISGSGNNQVPSGLFARTYTDTNGNGGSLTINTQQLLIQDGAAIDTDVSGKGKGGDLTVNANRVQVVGSSPSGQRSSLSADVLSNATGNAGNLRMNTRQLLIRDGAQVGAGTFGRGKGGNLTVNATDFVQVIGRSTDGQSSSFLTVQATSNATGDAGELTINTGQLLIRDGAQVSASTFGRGQGGNLTVNATDSVQVIGRSANGQIGSFLAAQTNSNATGGDAGELTINTKQFLIRDGAQVGTGTFGRGKGGNLTVNATDSVQVIGRFVNGQRSTLSAQAASRSTGDAGNLKINTGQLLIRDRAFVSAGTFGSGNGGNINITAQLLSLNDGGEISVVTGGGGSSGNMNIQAEQISMTNNAALIADLGVNARGRGGNISLDVKGSIDLIGGTTAPTGESTRITLGVQPRARGSGGDLKIRAGSLVLRDGALVKASTQGQGNAGNIYINAEVVDISGSVPSSGFPSGLFTSTDTNFKAGDIVIDTHTFSIADGAALSARSRGNGQGGNITVNANSFAATNGGQIVTTTFDKGRAGNIFVNAANTVNISGSDPNYTNRIAKFPRPVDSFVANAIAETGATSGLFANTQPNSTGEGGNIKIATGQLTIRDAAQITASSQGSGNAGSIEATASTIRLDNQGRIIADTTAGQGNINLRSQDLLLLRGGSNITTNARGSNTIGGNIDIDTNVLAAFENSDISANSNDFRGGNVRIRAQGILGIFFRDRNTPFSDLTATGASPELSGSVQVNDPDVDPSAGLVELPITLVDYTQLIAQGCPANRGNSFTVTGRGGLPPLPNDSLRSFNPIAVNWVALENQQQSSQEQKQQPISQISQNGNPVPAIVNDESQIVEATSWAINNRGEVALIASAPISTPYSSLSHPMTCPTPE